MDLSISSDFSSECLCSKDDGTSYLLVVNASAEKKAAVLNTTLPAGSRSVCVVGGILLVCTNGGWLYKLSTKGND